MSELAVKKYEYSDSTDTLLLSRDHNWFLDGGIVLHEFCLYCDVTKSDVREIRYIFYI